MFRVLESSSFAVQAGFYDTSSVLTLPTSVKYRIDDNYSGSRILDWTSLTPATQVTIPVSADQNAIYNRNNAVERRTLTVLANEGLSSEWTGIYPFEVQRIDGLLN